MAGLFIKLDHDWLRDPKVRNFRKAAGKAALVDLMQLFILLSRHKGRVDLNDFGSYEDAKDVLGMNDAKMARFLDAAAECGIIDAEIWQGLSVVTSNRAVKDAKVVEARRDAGKAGGQASGKARSK